MIQRVDAATRAELDDALTVGFWGAGSIGRVTWDRLLPSVAIAAVILLLFALALLERDGALLLVGWGAALLSVAAFGVTSDQLVDLIRGWWPAAWR